MPHSLSYRAAIGTEFKKASKGSTVAWAHFTVDYRVKYFYFRHIQFVVLFLIVLSQRVVTPMNVW